MISIEFDDAQYSGLISALDRLSDDGWIGDALKDAIPALGRANKAQFDLVSKTTAYSRGYIGKLKPSGRRRAGEAGDLGYGLDTLNLYSDLRFNWDLDGTQLVNFSDLGYAEYQEELLLDKQAKGEAQEGSFYADDETYYTILEAPLGDAAEKTWEN